MLPAMRSIAGLIPHQLPVSFPLSILLVAVVAANDDEEKREATLSVPAFDVAFLIGRMAAFAALNPKALLAEPLACRTQASGLPPDIL